MRTLVRSCLSSGLTGLLRNAGGLKCDISTSLRNMLRKPLLETKPPKAFRSLSEGTSRLTLYRDDLDFLNTYNCSGKMDRRSEAGRTLPAIRFHSRFRPGPRPFPRSPKSLRALDKLAGQ